ncbi:MAG TPA: phosphate ABC transporter permease subunit PstC [Candidatus Eisenbacteria bacterium]|nr:phosphate ABC transporter permease subunit PstC [Candidatus Eisenbacteria bacterium]
MSKGTDPRDAGDRLSRPAVGSRGFSLDHVYQGVLVAAATGIFLIVALIIFEVVRGALPSIRALGWGFLVDVDWDPVQNHFGALPYVYGTLVSSLLALLLAVPIGIGTSVFLAELAGRRLSEITSFVMELLAAIPSIVFGIWGLFVLAPFLRSTVEPWLIRYFGNIPLFHGYPFGIGMLNAGIVLSIMILPTIVSISREVLLATPRSLREASLALGATRAEAIGVTLDAAKPGILGAVILALGRAIGETMAVTMVIGNANRISPSLLDPAATMASIIANEFTEATTELYLSALIQIALVLFAVTLLVNALARGLVLWTTGGRRDVAGAA